MTVSLPNLNTHNLIPITPPAPGKSATSFATSTTTSTGVVPTVAIGNASVSAVSSPVIDFLTQLEGTSPASGATFASAASVYAGSSPNDPSFS